MKGTSAVSKMTCEVYGVLGCVGVCVGVCGSVCWCGSLDVMYISVYKCVLVLNSSVY